MRDKIYKITKITVFTTAILLFLIEAVYLFALPKFLNKYINSGKATALIKEKTGLDTGFKSFTVKTFPDFSLYLHAENFNIEKTAIIEKAEFKIYLASFLFKRINFEKGIITNSNITITRKKDGYFYLGNYKFNKDIKIDDYKLTRAALTCKKYNKRRKNII